MSFDTSPDYLLRAEDKALKMLYRAVEEPLINSFDEFFEGELYNRKSDDCSRHSLEAIEQYLKDSPNLHQQATSTESFRTGSSAPQPWRKGLWCLNGRKTPSLSIAKTRAPPNPQPQYISPTHLVKTENIPKSPAQPITTNRSQQPSVLPKSAGPKNGRTSQRTIIREQTLSPSPMYAQLPIHDGDGYHDSWQQDFKNFHLQMGHETDAMPSTFPHHTQARYINSQSLTQNGTVTNPSQSPMRYHYPFQHFTRQSNEIHIDDHKYMLDPFLENPQHKSSHSRQKINGSHLNGAEQQPTTIWTTASLHSSDSSHYSHSPHYSQDNALHNRHSQNQNVWISSSESQESIQRTPYDYHGNLVAPTAQRIPHNVLQMQLENNCNGLGIQYPHPNDIGVAYSYDQAHDIGDHGRPSTPPQQLHLLQSYPPLPPLPNQLLDYNEAFTTPRRRIRSMSQSPSPIISPSRSTPTRGRNQRSPSRQEQTSNRRKSMSKSGPIKEIGDTSRNRARSSSRPRTARTPRTPTGSFQLDFVNFTPKDAGKLIADVAPSGSSKTRARREQEAREKRKRLSEAAMQAVRRAGGDISVLEEAILV